MRCLQRPFLKAIALGCLFTSMSDGATLLLNGAQSAVLPNATTACLNAFSTSLNCPNTIHKLGYDFTYMNLALADFTAMCTSQCSSSLGSLSSAVKSGCGTYSFSFNGMNMSAVQLVDLYQYKYNMACLMSAETGQPCLIQEKTWNVTSLQQSNNATWPTYTNKTYPDWFNNPDTGAPAVDVNGTIIQNPFPNAYVLYNFPSSLPPTAVDLYNNGTAKTDANAGYSSMLEYDEYPLQIQCQSCFIKQFTTSVQSQWGETYDTIKAQVWANMQKNCNLTQTIVAANNITNKRNSGTFLNLRTVCPQKITVSGKNNNCSSIAKANNIESASISQLNLGVVCPNLANGTYCVTQSCQTATVSAPMSAQQFLNTTSAAANVTMYQFRAWNTFTAYDILNTGDVVCIGPPGGAYVPSTTVAQAFPTIYTTTASHASPTPSGTIPNCGSYYDIQQGDMCNSVALNKSITFPGLIDLNPSLNCNCTNLLLGFSYCVAPVNGTNVKPVTCTPPSTTTASADPSKCSQYVAPPTQTVSGTTSKCCTWYTTVQGDYCYAIDQNYGISLAQLRGWNTYINVNCTNLYVGYAHCMLSSIAVSS